MGSEAQGSQNSILSLYFPYAPNVRVPRQEPACEGGRLEALFDDQDWHVGVSATGVCCQVLLGSREGPLLLRGVGLRSYPQEHLITPISHC